MTIYKRKDSPYYWMSFRVNGKKITRSTKVKTMRLAKLILDNAFENELKPKGDKLLKDVQPEFEIYLESRNNEPYLSLLTASVREFIKIIGNKPIGSVSTSEVEDLITELLKNNSPSTVIRKIRLLSRFFKFSILRDYCIKNPTDGIDMPKLIPPNPVFFTSEQLKKVFNNGERYRDYYILLLHTGFRAGDAGLLKWSNIDFKSKTIRILIGKSKRPHSIPINKTLLKLLRRLKNDSEFIFPDLIKSNGTLNVYKSRNKRAYARKHLQTIIKNTGLHTFRHTCAAIMIQNGASLYEVSKYLGHSSVAVTERYAHLEIKHLKYASEILERSY